MPQLANRHTHKPTRDDVYIGRGSKYGNPYTVKEHGNRALLLHAEDFCARLLGNTGYPVTIWVDTLVALEFKTLVCSCAPRPCHGDIYLEWLDTYGEYMAIKGYSPDHPPIPGAVAAALSASLAYRDALRDEFSQPPVQSSLFDASATA
jgi:hypothetical protein